MLLIQDLTVAYGSITALSNVSLEIAKGEIVLLGGANGAGKSSLLRAISGLVAPVAGRIEFLGETILGWPAHRIAQAGIRHVPEGRRVWYGLTVHDHLDLAWHRLPNSRRRQLWDKITNLFPRLAERRNQRAGQLSGGEQQMLAIARGLAGDPSLLMIDELSLGLSPAIIKQLFAALKRVNGEDGITLLIVEQALHQALQIAHRGYVFETGRLVVRGTPEELRQNEVVQRAYLSV